MTASNFQIWVVILCLAAGTFLLRFSFLGLIGDRALPVWVTRALRYTAVGVLPGLVAPLVLWPAATAGQVDLARLAAAFVTLGVGAKTRNMITAILTGIVTLYAGLWLTGQL